MRCETHCPKGGGTGAAVAVLAVAVIAVADGRAISRAASEVLHVMVVAALSLAGLCLAVAVTAITVRLRRRAADRTAALAAATRSPAALPTRQPAAIEARRILPGVVIDREEVRQWR